MERTIFTSLVPGWERIFVPGDIDWRLVSWGGVLIDNRAYDETLKSCNCIPAADNPEVSSAAEATWLKDEEIIGVVTASGTPVAFQRRPAIIALKGGREIAFENVCL